MSRLMTATALGLAMAMAAGCAQQAQVGAEPVASVAPAAVADRIDNFRLVTHEGRALELYRMKDASAIVIMMHGVGSPEVAKAAPEFVKLQEAYKDKGVEFMMVNSNPNDKRADMLADAKKFGLKTPILQDDLQLVGGQIGASHVSQTFVVDPKTWKIAYNGELSAAPIDAVIAGKAVAVASTPVTGKLIKIAANEPAARAEHAKISYSRTIAPILEAKCVDCHQEGGIGPFAMANYEIVKGFAPMIRESIRTDRMPPWDPDPHIATFADDKSLSSTEIKTLINWIEAGAPRGDGADPLAAKRHVAPEWPLGKPDLIVDIPAYTVPASGVVDYQYPTVPNPLKEGKWLKASTAKVTQRQAVHHILSGIIPEGAEKKGMEAWGGGVGGYTVGMESTVQPKGIGSWVPSGGEFAYQMHYTPFGKEAVSAEQIGLYFYKDGEKPELIMRENALVNTFIEIPPYEAAHKETAYFLFPKDAILHTAVVHAHYRGTYARVDLQTPDGKRETILNVPFYDFNWQRMYEFAEPIKIPAGSKVISTYIYDNSARNPANPDPSEKVSWGDQSFEEMHYTSLRYRWADESVANPTNYDQLLLRTRLLGMMDTNLDDKVQVEELRGQFKTMLAAPGVFNMVDKNKDGGIDQEEFEAAMAMMPRGRRDAPPAATGGE